jgi:hypothetical protein
LGIDEPIWDAGRSGINLGGFGLHIRTEDIAKFGQLYLQEGEWNGKQLLPKEWVQAASSRQTSNGSNPKSDWDQGYGYQFWRCRNGEFRGDGAFGQYCVVMPKEHAVLAITSGVRDMQKVLDVTWDYLLPALRSASSVTKDGSAQNALKTRLAGLKLRTIGGLESSPILKEISGKKFKFPENAEHFNSISVVSGKDSTALKLELNGHQYQLDCVPGQWHDTRFAWTGVSPLEAGHDEPASASGAWNGNSFTAKIAFSETPYVLTLKCDFANDRVAVDPEFNVAFGPTKRPQLVGRVE